MRNSVCSHDPCPTKVRQQSRECWIESCHLCLDLAQLCRGERRDYLGAAGDRTSPKTRRSLRVVFYPSGPPARAGTPGNAALRQVAPRELRHVRTEFRLFSGTFWSSGPVGPQPRQPRISRPTNDRAWLGRRPTFLPTAARHAFEIVRQPAVVRLYHTHRHQLATVRTLTERRQLIVLSRMEKQVHPLDHRGLRRKIRPRPLHALVECALGFVGPVLGAFTRASGAIKVHVHRGARTRNRVILASSRVRRGANRS